VLNVGFICKRKNQLDAVEVIRMVLEKHSNVRFACIGSIFDAEYARALRERAAQGNLLGNVHLLGYRSDVPRYLLAADALLHTSRSEAHARAVLEAMAAGLPVVVYQADGVRGTVVDGATGYIVPPGDVSAAADAICRLMDDPELQFRMGSAGHARVVQHFTAEVTAGLIDMLIQSVLLNRKRSGISAR
jgi:glycosyltransferase involved in cell wall biosynthesis